MQLTKNFKKEEFDSKDGTPMPASVLINIKKLTKNLQVLRDHFGLPIIINSGYRSPSHNRKVGGAVASQHLYGRAADIRIPGKTPRQIFAAIEALQRAGKMEIGGLHAYATFVHYDIRGRKARW